MSINKTQKQVRDEYDSLLSNLVKALSAFEELYPKAIEAEDHMLVSWIEDTLFKHGRQGFFTPISRPENYLN